jgi:hypothetical protein
VAITSSPAECFWISSENETKVYSLGYSLSQENLQEEKFPEEKSSPHKRSTL